MFRENLENFRERSFIQFVSKAQQAETFARRATFMSLQVIGQDLLSIFEKFVCSMEKAYSHGNCLSKLAQIIFVQVPI